MALKYDLEQALTGLDKVSRSLRGIDSEELPSDDHKLHSEALSKLSNVRMGLHRVYKSLPAPHHNFSESYNPNEDI